MDEDTSYLEPGFDASTLTSARIRSILVAHNVHYPSSAKKPELVQLFTDNVAAQARKIRTAQSKTKRSTRGIVNVSPGGNPTGAHTAETDEDDVAPLQTPARTSSRRTGRASTDEIAAPTPRTSRSTRQSTAPITSYGGNERLSNGLDGAQDALDLPKVRRTRKSSTSPVKREKDSHRYSDEGGESPFSQDNPFQSASPPPGLRSRSGPSRRTTLGRTNDADVGSAVKPRRRTGAFEVVKHENGSARKRSATPGGASSPIKIESDDDIPAGEEFTPDQQLELDQALAGSRSVVRRPTRPRGSAAKAGSLGAILVTALSAIAASAAWRQEKINVGYCGIGQPTTSIASQDLPPWVDTFRPQCEPCPQHAYCYADLKTVCEPGFVLTPHPLSFNGAIPLPPTCEPDGEKARKVKAVADFAVEKELRERNAEYECGDAKTPEVSVEDLKTAVASKRSRKMTDEEFDELWESALGEIAGRDEVEVHGDSTSSSTRLRSNSLARLPLGCAIRRSVRATLKQYIPQLAGLIMLALSAAYGRHALTVRKSTSTRARTLAGSALSKLALQASLHAEDPASYPESWVSVVALRDDVLREEFNAKERGRLWEVVRGLVEGNANVRSMVREGRTGEVSRVWEWIGAVQRIESPDGVRRSRLSLGGTANNSALDTPSSGQQDRSEMTEISKWTEGNSSYY